MPIINVATNLQQKMKTQNLHIFHDIHEICCEKQLPKAKIEDTAAILVTRPRKNLETKIDATMSRHYFFCHDNEPN